MDKEYTPYVCSFTRVSSKILALVVAVLMIVASVSAFAADTAPATADATISISNLDIGDTVNLYQVLHWVSGEGWRLTDAFTGLTTTSGNLEKLITPVKNQGTISFTKEDLEEITNFVKNNSVAPTKSEATKATTYEYTTYTPAAGETAAVDNSGLYLALVEPVKAGTVYNPIVVSSDYTPEGTGSGKNETNKISALLNMGNSSVAKKETVTLTKTEPKITNDIADTYTFTIDTIIPVYSKSFKNTYFNISDTMSSYLSAVAGSLTIEDDKGATVTPSSNTFAGDVQSFTIGFDDTFIKALATPLHIKIKYDAKLNITKEQAAALTNVKEENNKVTVEFPNNPKDDTSKTVLKDETREYTFTIDGQLFGETDWLTSEVIKVGLDQDGYPIEEVIDTYKSGKTHAALNGATFQLYQEDGTTPYTNGAWDCHR